MRKAARVHWVNAFHIRYERKPDSPQTTEVRQFLAANVPENASAKEKYSRALDENERRATGSQWPDKSLRKASGIDRSEATRIRRFRAPATPRTQAIRDFLATGTQENESRADKYRRALQENQQKEQGQQWPDASMQKAAGIQSSHAQMIRKELRLREPDTPRTIMVREFLAARLPSHVSASKKYRHALDENERRTEGQKWPDESMQKAAMINPRLAREIRARRGPDTPETSEIRAFLATETAQTAVEKYRLALEANSERMEGQKWRDSSLQKAAGIGRGLAARVRGEWRRTSSEGPESNDA
jgi:hypothetical protein